MLLDVSVPVTPETAEWPGDVPFTCGMSATKKEGASVNLGWIKTSPHVGTHVDAPFHYDDAGPRVKGLALDAFVGRCIVVDAVGRDAIDEQVFRGVDLRGAPRVLVRTQRVSEPATFLREFPVLTMGAIDALAQANVRLVGVDVPSVDRFDSKDLAVHHALGRAGIANVENLALAHVQPGNYELLAAPLSWPEMDAAPLRALLRK